MKRLILAGALFLVPPVWPSANPERTLISMLEALHINTPLELPRVGTPPPPTPKRSCRRLDFGERDTDGKHPSKIANPKVISIHKPLINNYMAKK